MRQLYQQKTILIAAVLTLVLCSGALLAKDTAVRDEQQRDTKVVASGVKVAPTVGQSESNAPPVAIQPDNTQDPTMNLPWSAVGGGGVSNVVGTNYGLGLSLGLPAAGEVQGETYKLSLGFWQDLGGSGPYCCGMYDPDNRTGNVDQDVANVKDLTDILMLASWAFLSGDDPPCFAEMNTNGDAECVYDLGDVLTLASYAYLGGELPAYCLPECE